MEMITSMLIKKIFTKVAEDHPVILSDNCINNVQRRFSCSVCADSCHENVFTEYGPRFDKCTNCNLCLVTCPAQAILPPVFLMQQIISNIEAKKENVYVYCHKRDGKGDININCLASLPWEIYTALALNKEVVFSLLPCKQCEYTATVTPLLNKIKETMGEDFFREHFSSSNNAIDDRTMSRREMFHSLKKDLWSAFDYIIPDTNTFNPGGLFYREFLLKKLLLPENNQIGCSWKTPIFNNNCWGCGLCATVCPNKAITTFEKDNDEQCLVHIPWRCTQCGLCAKYCQDNCISGWKLLEKSVLVQQKVYIDINAEYCPECKKTMKPVDNGYFCYYCGRKEKTKNV